MTIYKSCALFEPSVVLSAFKTKFLPTTSTVESIILLSFILPSFSVALYGVAISLFATTRLYCPFPSQVPS